MNVINLKQTGSGWQFEGEEAVEDFVWANLPQLFGLTPLKRQYIIDEQRCDILALAENDRLVVIELKNVEDRYVVQQLTRYYHALQEEKPFSEQVDYEQPIRLIAVTPSFHRDNFTDRKYCHLDIEFLQFGIVVDGESFYLQLKDVESEEIRQLEIPHQERESNENISAPPKLLQKLLNNCEIVQQEEIMKIRHKILYFDKRLQEITSAGSIIYGNGRNKTSKLCAELCPDSKGNLVLFLWLPLKGGRSERVARARIWTDWNGRALVEGFVPSGIGVKITSAKKVMAKRIENLKEMAARQSIYSSDFKCIRQYCKDVNLICKKLEKLQPVTYEELKYLEIDLKHHAVMVTNYTKYVLTDETYQVLDGLIDLALEKWLARI